MRPVLLSFAAAVTALTGVTLVIFHELVRHPTAVLVGPQRAGSNDLTTYFIPVHDYPRQCWKDYKQLPFWNPFRNAGAPHLGNPQVALFYPPNWLCWWNEAAHVLSWSLVAHHLFAGVGTYLLCRRYSLGWLASVTGGSVFLGAPYLVAQTGEGHYAQICAVAWMPWAFLAFESVREARWWAIAPMAASLAFSFLAGHIQEFVYVGLILTAWIALDGVLCTGSGAMLTTCRLVACWLLVAVITVGLVATDLISAMLYATESARSTGLTADEAGRIGLSGVNLFQLLNPFALGGPASYGGPDKFFWESLCSFGIGPIVLAMVGVLGSWTRYPVRRIVCTGILAFFFAFGSGNPVFHALFWLVPGLDHFRAPSRAMFFCSLVVAVLAAVGVDSLVQGGDLLWQRRRTVRRGVLGCCAALFVAMAAIRAFGMKDRPARSEPVEPVSESPVTVEGARNPSDDSRSAILRRAVERSVGSATSYAWVLGACMMVYLAAWHERLARPAACGLWVLGVVQLGQYASKMLAILPAPTFMALGSGHSLAVSDPGPFRVLAPLLFWSEHRSQADRICRLQGYDPVPLARYLRFMAALTGKDDPTSVVVGDSSPEIDRLRESLLDLANVQFVVQHAQRSLDVPANFQWRLIGRESTTPPEMLPGDTDPGSYVLFENTDALPRAFIVGQTRLLQRQENPVSALAGLRPRAEVLTTAEFMPPVPRSDFAAARIVEYTPNRVVIEADLSAVGYLVLTDTWYPGWTANDNGRPTSVLPANVAFRAVPLSAGSHHVVFQYRPVGFGLAATVSIATWFIVGTVAIICRCRGRSKKEATTN